LPVPARFAEQTGREIVMKRFEAASLIPGATWHAEAAEEAEVVRRAVENLRRYHGETEIRPEMIERIKERIVEVGR
jgi:predicted small metal-binding protein